MNGEWHFLGACEPEEVLDTGWFSGPANRAILIHTRNFSDYVKESNEEYLEKKERCTILTIRLFMAERSW